MQLATQKLQKEETDFITVCVCDKAEQGNVRPCRRTSCSTGGRCRWREGGGRQGRSVRPGSQAGSVRGGQGCEEDAKTHCCVSALLDVTAFFCRLVQ